MVYRLEPASPVGEELARVAGEDIDAALAALGAHAPSADDIHLVRKRLKRLRAVVRLGRGVLGPDRAREENAAYRDAGRRLSARRDADVLVETADRLWAVAAASEPAPVASPLAAVRDRLALEAKEVEDPAGEVAAVVESLESARRRVASWPTDGGWDDLAPGLTRQYRRGRRAFEALGDAPDDESLHAWRKRAKDHWYHLKLLHKAWPPVVRALEKQAHRLADLLGDDHDLAVLSARVGDVGNGIEDLIASERARLQTEARPLGARLYIDPPARWANRMGTWWACAATDRRQRSDPD